MPPKKGFKRNIENNNNNNTKEDDNEGNNNSRSVCGESMEVLIKLFQQVKNCYRQEKLDDYTYKLNSLGNDENEVLLEKISEMRQRYTEERDHISKRFDVKIVCVTEETDAHIRTINKQILMHEKNVANLKSPDFVSTPFIHLNNEDGRQQVNLIDGDNNRKVSPFELRMIENVYRKPAPYTSRMGEILEKANNDLNLKKNEKLC